MTVVIGVGTVNVVPVGVVTVTVAIGVLTVTAAGNVGIERVGRERVGTRSVRGSGECAASAADEWTDADAGVAPPPDPCVEAGAALTLGPPAGLT